MGKRSRRDRQMVREKIAPRQSKTFYFLLGFFLFSTAIYWVYHKTSNREEVVNVDAAEILQLTNQLLASVDPASADNAYMPALMKEKISWIFSQNAANRFSFNLTAAYGLSKATIMSSSYYQGKPHIEIYGPRLWSYVRQQQKVKKGFNQISKNIFSLSLTHEAIHLERGEEYLIRNHTDQEILDEEVRAWVKNDIGAVRPLRQAGQPVDIDNDEFDEILKSCHDDPNCPKVRNYIRPHSAAKQQ